MLVKYYLLVCLVVPLVKNADAEISLDYYFGFEDTLRTTEHLDDCNSDRSVKQYCEEKCRKKYACSAGKCFCLLMKSQIKKTILESNLPKLKFNVVRTKQSSYEKTVPHESRSEEGISNLMVLNEQSLRPSLRHHIAHFCPNLDIARECIRTCMIQNKPAFCGKDHVCYCGHRYGSPSDDMEHSTQGYGQFYDLYEKYFGPQQALKLNTKWTGSTTTTELYNSHISFKTDEDNEFASDSESYKNIFADNSNKAESGDAKNSKDNLSDAYESKENESADNETDANDSNAAKATQPNKVNENGSAHANYENKNTGADDNHSNEAESIDSNE